jgi:hypothetical protein
VWVCVSVGRYFPPYLPVSPPPPLSLSFTPSLRPSLSVSAGDGGQLPALPPPYIPGPVRRFSNVSARVDTRPRPRTPTERMRWGHLKSRISLSPPSLTLSLSHLKLRAVFAKCLRVITLPLGLKGVRTGLKGITGRILFESAFSWL